MNNIARYVDLTNLSATATPQDIINLCDTAVINEYKSVCVHSSYLPLVVSKLSGSNVLACTVIGFPMGMMSSIGKYEESRKAVADGANELDMVLNVGRYKAGEYDYCKAEIMDIMSLGATVKVIIETALLTDDEIAHCAEMLITMGVHYIKTSTGFSTRGASENDIAIMRRIAGNMMAVKASGGIRDLDKAILMLEAGADRIGASANLAQAAMQADSSTQARLNSAIESTMIRHAAMIAANKRL